MSEWKKPLVFNAKEATERIEELEEKNRQLKKENTDLWVMLFQAYCYLKAEVNDNAATNNR